MTTSLTGEATPTAEWTPEQPGTGHGQRIAGNFGLLTAFKFLSDAFTFALFVVMSRTYGEIGIGAYSFAVGIGSGFAVLADYGLYRLSIKDLARRDDDFAQELASILALRWVLTLASLLVLAATTLLLPIDDAIRPVSFIVGLHLLLYGIANGLGAVFIARQDTFLAAGLDFGGKALAAAAGVGLILAGFELPVVLWALPAATALQIVVSRELVRRKYNPTLVPPQSSTIRKLWHESLPYFSSTFVRYVTIRSDIVLLGLLGGAAAAGIYNVAYRLVFLLMYIPFYASLAMLPVVSRLHHRGSNQARALVQPVLGWMILIGVPASFGLALVAEPLLTFVFGPRFLRSVPILQVLAWLFFLSCLRNMLATVLTACDRQTERTRLETIAAVIAVAANLFLILRYGPIGAAVAILIAEVILVVMTVIATRDMLDLPFLASRLAISLLASAAFVVPAVLLPNTPLFALIPIAAAIYVTAMLAFPTIRRHELSALASIKRGSASR